MNTTPPPAVPLTKLSARDLVAGDIVHRVHVRAQDEPVTVDALVSVGRSGAYRVVGHTAGNPVPRVMWQGIARTTDVLVERSGPDEPVEGYGDPAPLSDETAAALGRLVAELLPQSGRGSSAADVVAHLYYALDGIASGEWPPATGE